MAELTTAVNELLKGKRVEENLGVYVNGLLSLYRKMAYLRMSMNFYTFAEIYSEMEPDRRDKISSAAKRVCELVKKSVLEPENSGDMEEAVAAVRDELINIMEILTAYTDRFQVYEYMLNRVEYKFCEPDFDNSYYFNGFENDIEEYIKSDTDNTVVNIKIAEIVGQLPMRLSQNKFFDILNNTFTLYKSSDRLAVDEFVYMIRTAGLLYEPDGFDVRFPEFRGLDRRFCEVNFAAIDDEVYYGLRGELDDATLMVEDYSDACVMLAEVINDVYSIILTQGALSDVNETDRLVNVIREAYEIVINSKAVSDEVDEVFDEIMGQQEKTSQLIYTPEVTLDEIRSINGGEIARLNMEKRLDALSKLSKLQSPSTFARLNVAPEATECGGDEYAMEAARGLMTEFAELFDKHGRMFKRAVMASVISNLPTFFNNIQEFREYVHVALGQCSDEAERQACMSLINMMIAGE